MRLGFLLFQIFFSLSLVGQNNYAIIESLDKAELLSKREKAETLKDLKQQEEHRKKFANDDRAYYEKPDRDFYPLQLLMRAKIHSTSGTLSLTMFSPAPVKILRGQENTFISKLSVFAKKVLVSKLVSEKTYEESLAKIQSLDLRSEYEVASFMANRAEKEFYLQPKRYKKFADSLLAKDLITANDYNVILTKLQNGEFRNYADVYPFLRNFLTIDLRAMPSEPIEFLEAVHRKTAEVLPQLAFDSFSTEIIKDKIFFSKDYASYNVRVKLIKGNDVYFHKSFFKGVSKRKDVEPDPYPIDAQEYYEVFNKILVDQGSVQRLHIVQMGGDKIGVLPLTKRQFENLMWSYNGMGNGGYIQLSYENFNPQVTQKKLLEVVRIFDSIGLLTRYSQKQKDSTITAALETNANHFSDILSQFPGLVFEIDLEYGVTNGQYKTITRQIADASNGRFKPANIVDGYDCTKRKTAFDYGFTLNGKPYRTKLKQKDDWLDPGFWELIEKAITEQDTKGKFYAIYPNDGIRFIYLTHEQYDLLKEKNLLELEEVND